MSDISVATILSKQVLICCDDSKRVTYLLRRFSLSR
uniref:Uncharacterized protein n=1 Tax=Octopus bimaculoides TaxID=37653 RepID=A0A0L8GU11_OCTBM